jgi:2-C-methyl-D-erythritol 4-phosphate cytidylyltransferase
METPQVFARNLLDRAYARVAKKKLRITDDAQAVEALDHPIALLENAEPNPKVTHPADLPYLEFLLAPKPVAPAVVDSSAPFPPAAS